MRTEIDGITSKIIGTAIWVHQSLGPGLLESAYESVMEWQLQRRGLFVERQKSVDLVVEDFRVPHAYTVDLLVNGLVVVELKSVETLAPIHAKQVLTYLRLLDLHAGLLINFGEETLTKGLRRLVNGPPR
ncbi:MAG TPA: GxxExxY protein [Longimicrobiales bacterium]